MTSKRDPRRILGISEKASGEEIRQAYLRGVQAHPPDRDPVEFEHVRDAYELLRDPRRRAMSLLQANPCSTPLEHLLTDIPESRRFVGPTVWLPALRED